MEKVKWDTSAEYPCSWKQKPCKKADSHHRGLLTRGERTAVGALQKASGGKGKLSPPPGWGKEDKKHWKKVADDSTNRLWPPISPEGQAASPVKGFICLTTARLERAGGQEGSGQREPRGGHCSSPADSQATALNGIVHRPVVWHDVHMSTLLKSLIAPIGVPPGRGPGARQPLGGGWRWFGQRW